MISFVTILGVIAVLTWPIAFIIAGIIILPKARKMSYEMYPGVSALLADEDSDEETDCAEEEQVEDDYILDEFSFCQLFSLGPEMCLLIDHVEMCPDETAFIRVVDDDNYTPLYKRKVRREKDGTRFIVFNSTKYILNDKKTQPVIRN